MRNSFHHVPRLELFVAAGDTKKYTTLLQSGILWQSNATTTVGQFLSSLPGFTHKYIVEHIETIFLNGQPIDDLATQLNGPSAVLALSAAMPGLAGAIFRKNSFHAPLRTTDYHALPDSLPRAKSVVVQLKCFNCIAREKGQTLLHNGCFFKSDSLVKFLSYRGKLFTDLLSMRYNDKPINLGGLEPLLHQSETIFLRIYEDNVTI